MERCPKRRAEKCTLSKAACGVVIHHIFYPRPAYIEAGPVAEAFRELSINKVPMCKQDEIDLHNEQPDGPPMPTAEVMESVVNNEKLRRSLAVRPINRP